MKAIVIAVSMFVSCMSFAAQPKRSNRIYVVKYGNEYITCNPAKGPMDALCNLTLEPAGDLILTAPTAVARGFDACAKYGAQTAKNVPVPVFDVVAGGVACVGTGFLATLEGVVGGIIGTIGDIFR